MNQERSYRAVTRAAAEAAYHADAHGMVRMGYAPISEDWSTELEQVLTVRYVHAPEKASAVLQALAEVEAEPTVQTQRPRRLAGSLLEHAPSRYSVGTLKAKLLVGGFTGIVAGIAVGSALASSMFGNDVILSAVSIVALDFVGLFIGSMAAFIWDQVDRSRES
jgi:hypothetical protein